jgi:hypothetical protein
MLSQRYERWGFTDLSNATTAIDDELIEERLLEKGGVNP